MFIYIEDTSNQLNSFQILFKRILTIKKQEKEKKVTFSVYVNSFTDVRLKITSLMFLVFICHLENSAELTAHIAHTR